MKFTGWYVPQIPHAQFEAPPRDTLKRALEDLELLTEFSTFEFENRIKPDYSDMCGVRVELEVDGELEVWDVDMDLIEHFGVISRQDIEEHADLLQYMGIDTEELLMVME